MGWRRYWKRPNMQVAQPATQSHPTTPMIAVILWIICPSNPGRHLQLDHGSPRAFVVRTQAAAARLDVSAELSRFSPAASPCCARRAGADGCGTPSGRPRGCS